MSQLSTGAALVAMRLVLIFLYVAGSSPDGDSLLQMKIQWQATRLSWSSGSDPCTQNWTGVTCNGQGRIIALNLTNQGLKGPIPKEISNLEFLTNLDLGNSNFSSFGPWNHITGDLSAIGGLTQLQSLNMSFNVLGVEKFPLAVLRLTNLTDLRLDHTGMKGVFPKDLANLTKLQYLYLGNNSMTGEFPDELGNLVDLLEFSMWGSKELNSSIPKEFGLLANLKYLNLHGSNLWGGLPSEFGNLRNIERMLLYTNTLTGSIPETWQNMKSLQALLLDNNYLTRSFPIWLLNQSRLQILDISNNNLYGEFPNVETTNLTSLIADCNYFNGSGPASPKKNTTFSASGNCFNNTSQGNCRKDPCIDFISKLFNGCPLCPQSQKLQDKTLCVCGFEANSSGIGETGQAKSSKIGIILGSISTVVFFALVVLLAFYFRKKSKKGKPARLGRSFIVEELYDYWEAPKGVQKFTLHELVRATDNFDENHAIGAGGFGKVFYGVLDNGKKVAIKRASATGMQGSVEFRNEVLILSRLHHRNLVQLEGFYEDAGLQVLVYEYMPNGNLHDWLFQKKKTKTLNWYKRLEIAVGIAQALGYLHYFADPPVIHRDVKPSNILLDEFLVAKLADFGISKATPEFETHVSTTPAGTAGYIDPQYFLRRKLTTASDVYSFGVVLLELITGQKAIDHMRLDEYNLVEWVGMKLEVEGIRGIVDPQCADNFPEKIYHDIARLALDCASFNKNDRPAIREVVTILEAHLSEVSLPNDIILQPDESFQNQLSIKKFNSTQRSESRNLDSSSGSNEATTSAAFEVTLILPR